MGTVYCFFNIFLWLLGFIIPRTKMESLLRDSWIPVLVFKASKLQKWLPKIKGATEIFKNQNISSYLPGLSICRAKKGPTKSGVTVPLSASFIQKNHNVAGKFLGI